MNNHFLHLKNLVKKIAIAFLIFSICRIIFYSFYSHQFDEVSISLFFYGIRFDMVAISLLFAPIVALELIPFSFRGIKWYQQLLKVLFFVTIILCITLNMVDIGYFEYTLKRTTADLFGMVTTGDDFFTLLPHYIIDFWYAYVLLAILIYFTFFIYKKFCKTTLTRERYVKRDYVIQTTIFIIFSGVLVIGMRGGLQYKPLSIINAAQYAESQNIPIVLNTPFSVIKTISSDQLEVKTYYSDSEIMNIYTPEQKIKGTGEFNGKNIVFIILESFAKEYVGTLNNTEGYTPFLDSLIGESYVYTNAYANGQRSMESLPSILAGLPQLMSESYIISNYANNELDGLPKLLKQNGYNTSFYHGGANGTMGFNGFAKMIGIDNYFGMNEYPKTLKEKNYDGLWGIFDEPYLQYYADELNKKFQPFFSSVFTLSSHHPYTIPKNHLNQFPKGNLDIHESIGYADYSLKRFFEKAQSMSWFKNTLFVITADHSSLSESKFYKTKLNRFAIPILIYDPSGNLKGQDNKLFQQIDITPTLISLTSMDARIISFGNNSFNNKERNTINYVNNTYQIAFDDYFMIFDGEETTSFYNTKKDTLLSKNLITKLSPKEKTIKNRKEKQLKAIVQQYNNRLINNNLSKN